jgi:hypothetical protein
MSQSSPSSFSSPFDDTASTFQIVVALLREWWARWRRGERPHAEDYLRRAAQSCPPSGLPDADAFAFVHAEVYLRRADGEAPPLEEYLARFPQFAARLQALFRNGPAFDSTTPFTLRPTEPSALQRP